MVKKRKRAPGGGRKPRSGPTTSLTFRIPDDMRKRLEFEASEKRNATVSERLLWHLRQSLNREAELGRDEATRAYCFLIYELSDRIRWAAGPTGYWERNPFVFKAFKLAVDQLLSLFEPKGEIERPPVEDYLDEMKILTPALKKLMAEPWESPERAADSAVRMLLANLASEGPALEDAKQYWSKRESALGDLAQRFIKSEERTHYGMADVRRVLSVDVNVSKSKDKADD